MSMSKPNLIDLPDLNMYRETFINEGLSLPLPKVSFSPNGLLSELPSPDINKVGWPWTVESEIDSYSSVKQTSWPKISIVMPSYNQGKFIEETIRSVLLQNYPNLEFIVCDGGSNDKTQEILERYKPWLSFCQSKKDKGQGHAINLGFSIASGDYFGWINSDDFYLPNCFRTLTEHFQTTSAEFIYGDAIIFYDDTQNISYWQANLVLDRYLRFGGLIASHAAFWKSSIHQPIWERMNCNVDGELWLRLVPRIIKSHLRYPLSVCRVQTQSKSSSHTFIPLWREDDVNIASIYGLPPYSRSFISYEYRLVQSIYKASTKRLIIQNIKELISQNIINPKLILY